jgi:hypothetical protein|tara:strand:- start:15747 stop:16610 length:864 start_codon:yes stop_codon:yes gene_type:complete
VNTKKLLKTVTLLAAFSLLTVSCSQENVEVSVGIDTSADPAVSPIELSLDGIWQAMGSASWNLEGHTASKTPVTRVLGALGGIPAGMSVVEGGVIPYLPAALEQRNANLESWNEKDSVTKCYIPGIPRLTYMPFPLQIFQTESKIFMAYEFGGNSRTIHMDRPGTSAPLPSWMGYSLGHWEGNTLVVDVSSQMAETWFDSAGNFHSGALHVEERYTPIDANHIEYEATITDPEVFSRSWKIKLPLYRRLEENVRLLEYKCVEFAEDLLYDHLRKDYEGPKNLDGSVN